jgi:hypothetical protein
VQRGSALVYDGLPISSGGAHGLGRISPHDAYDAWSRFLSACTVPGAITCFFDLPDTPELAVERSVRRLLGRTFPPAGRRFPVPTRRVPEALELLATLEPQPTNRWGMAPVWLRFSADFALRHPDGHLWPGQDRSEFGFFETPGGVRLGASMTNLSLQARRSMGLLLSVPDATDAEAVDLIPWLQSHLPFQLSPKHWTRWTLTKNGRTYRGQKLVL